MAGRAREREREREISGLGVVGGGGIIYSECEVGINYPGGERKRGWPWFFIRFYHCLY